MFFRRRRCCCSLGSVLPVGAAGRTLSPSAHLCLLRSDPVVARCLVGYCRHLHNGHPNILCGPPEVGMVGGVSLAGVLTLDYEYEYGVVRKTPRLKKRPFVRVSASGLSCLFVPPSVNQRPASFPGCVAPLLNFLVPKLALER